MNIKKFTRYLVAYVTPIIFFVWVGYYISLHPDDFTKVFFLSPPVLILLVLLQIFSIWVASMFTLILVAPFGVNLKFQEYFGITVIARTLNMLLPVKGGAGVRGLYLKMHHNLPFSDFLAMFAGQTVLTMFVSSVICLVALSLIYLNTGLFDLIGFMFFMGIASIFGFFVFWSPILPASKNPILNKAKRVLDSWHELRTNHLLVLKVCIFSAINTLLSASTIGILFWALSNPQAFSAALYLGGNQDVMYMASFTPGSLGIVEASTVFLSHNLSISVSDTVLVVLYVRALLFLVTAILTPFFAYRLFKDEVRQLFKRWN